MNMLRTRIHLVGTTDTIKNKFKHSILIIVIPNILKEGIGNTLIQIYILIANLYTYRIKILAGNGQKNLHEYSTHAKHTNIHPAHS